MERATNPAIPAFRPDGYLPAGLFFATEAEVTFRFGASSRRRGRLILRVRRWIELAGEVHARRSLIDGSFITSRANPNDVDAVILLPTDFESQIERSISAAMELEQMLLSRQPEEIFAAEDDTDWREWIEFFGRTRSPDERRKGLVEIEQ